MGKQTLDHDRYPTDQTEDYGTEHQHIGLAGQGGRPGSLKHSSTIRTPRSGQVGGAHNVTATSTKSSTRRVSVIRLAIERRLSTDPPSPIEDSAGEPTRQAPALLRIDPHHSHLTGRPSHTHDLHSSLLLTLRSSPFHIIPRHETSLVRPWRY